MTPPLFLVTAVGQGEVVLDGAEGHHAADVMRLSVGEQVLVSDGAGVLGKGVVSHVARGRVGVSVKEVDRVPPANPRFVVVQALARGGRDETAVEAMTEVGVDEVVGWQAARSVAKWTGRTQDKWESVVRAATKQSRRAWLPVVTGPASTADVVERLTRAELAVVLDAGAERSLAEIAPPASGEVVVVVGPEGGLTDAELERFSAAGAVAARLGTTVLRASTAGVAAVSVLSAADRWR